MLSRSKFITCFFILALIVVEGCADSTDDSAASTNTTLDCGPNATFHAGGTAGMEDHCDCNSGYSLYDGECISDDSPEFNTPPPVEEPPKEDERALPLSCWLSPDAQCDPRNGAGCDLAAGDTCDLATTDDGSLNLFCLPGPNTQSLGQSCDPASGPFCAVGMHCVDPGSCKTFCCHNGDCSNGDKCKPFAMETGSLGVCDDGSSTPPPACGGPGASCSMSSQCCSNDCHAGHCH